MYLFHDAGDLHEWPDALRAQARLGSHAVDFDAETTWPSNDLVESSLGLDSDQGRHYDELVCDDEAAYPFHRMFGHPDLVQEGDMREAAAKGLQEATASRGQSELHDNVSADVCEWLLLLQVDSDSALGFSEGRLYFWIRRQDLAAERFDNCWAILLMD